MPRLGMVLDPVANFSNVGIVAPLTHESPNGLK
jgi:hypothetical protein